MNLYHYDSLLEIQKGRSPLPKMQFENIFSQAPERLRLTTPKENLLPQEIWKEFIHYPYPAPKNFWVESFAGHGRIGANVSTINPDIGYVGFFEMQNEEVGLHLLQKAVQWLKSQNVKEIYGPVNFNTWFSYRFRTDSEPLGFSWEPHQPQRYIQCWQKAGFKMTETYHSQGLTDLGAYQAQVRPDYDKAIQEGFSFRPFNSQQLESHEIPLLYQISMQGFSGNFLFEPITEKAFQSIYVPIMKKSDLSHAFWLLDPQKKEVGFFFGFIDKEYLVLKTTTVLKPYRGRGLSNALSYLVAESAVQKGIQKWITALVKDNAQSQSYGKKSQELWRHSYALMKY